MIHFQDHFLKLHLYNPLIGHKTFEFSPKDSVSDLRNTVCQTTELMMYENFHFEHESKVLSEFLEMSETLTSGAKINIVFNPFDQRSSKFHYHKIKNLLENPSILISHNYGYDELNAKKQTNSSKGKITQNIDSFLQAIQKQEFMDVKLLQIEHNFSEWLNFSGYNPPPYYRRLMGDYYYVYFKSPEQMDYHITGHAEGFFLNQSTNAHFNPNISSKNSRIFISLLDLLYAISPKFKEIFKNTLNKIKNHEYQRTLIGPLLNKKTQWMKDRRQTSSVNMWKINPLQRGVRKQQILTIKDWNQMFQIQHLQPSSSLYQKINRQKLKFKIYQQFVDHSKMGAISIIDKQIQPINPNSPKKQQTFLFTNIYFSFVDNSFEEKDLMDLLKSNGSDFTKYNKKKSKAVNNYILNLETIDNTEGLDLHLSHSVLIQYKGQKIRAQSYPSSLIHTKAKNEAIESIIERKNYINRHIHMKENNPQFNKDFSQALMKLSFKLNLEHDMVIKMLKEDLHLAKKIAISTEIKGVQISDKRFYLFHLHSLLPKDYNFTHSQEAQKYLKETPSKENNNGNNPNLYTGYDEEYDNFVLRPQLTTLYNQKFKCRVPINSMLGKTLHGECEVVMNEKLRTQEKKLKAMAGFAKDHVIAMVINALQGDMKKYLADTKNIVEIMHKYGLNVRYLGFLNKKIDKKKSPHIEIIVEKAIYIKCIKNIMNTALKSISSTNSKYLISHLLNCIFYPSKVTSEQYNSWKSSKQEQSEQQQNNDALKKRKKKTKDNNKERQDSLLTLFNQENGEFFLSIKPVELSELVKRLAKIKYNHQFDVDSQKVVQPKIFKFLYGKASVLRDVCLNSGIVLQKRDYFSAKLSSSSRPFLPEFIYGFNPRCTHTNSDKKQLDHLIAQGDNFLAQFFVEESIQSYNKAIQYILTTFGGNNEKLPLIHKKLSFIYFKIGDVETALLFGSHSLGMFEEFYGFQHVETIDNLAILGIYHCAERNFAQAQQSMFKALYYAYVAFGQIYPEILILWLNLSTIYEIQKQYTEAIMCLYEGLRVCLNVFSQYHLNTAVYYAALSYLHFEIPDIMSAIKFKEKSLSILQKLLPENDNRIKESLQILEYMKSLQSSKKIKEIHEKELRKLQNSTFGYHSPQVGSWQYNGRNGRGNPPGNLMAFGHKNIGRMQEYFLRESEQYWRRTAYGGRKMR